MPAPTLGDSVSSRTRKRKAVAIDGVSNGVAVPAAHEGVPIAKKKRETAAASRAKSDSSLKIKAASVVEHTIVITEKKRKIGGRAKFFKPIDAAEAVQKHFRFLDLPAELRNQIYELALVGDHHTIGSNQPKIHGFRNARKIRVQTGFRRPVSPAILLLNRQTYAEGIGFLYSQPLSFEGEQHLLKFLNTIGASNKAMLTDLTVDITNADFEVLWCLIDLGSSFNGATGLRRCTVQHHHLKAFNERWTIEGADYTFYIGTLPFDENSRGSKEGEVEVIKEPFEGCYSIFRKTFHKA